MFIIKPDLSTLLSNQPGEKCPLLLLACKNRQQRPFELQNNNHKFTDYESVQSYKLTDWPSTQHEHQLFAHQVHGRNWEAWYKTFSCAILAVSEEWVVTHKSYQSLRRSGGATLAVSEDWAWLMKAHSLSHFFSL